METKRNKRTVNIVTDPTQDQHLHEQYSMEETGIRRKPRKSISFWAKNRDKQASAQQ